eukprot:1465551-Rhodomonas_salina.2
MSSPVGTPLVDQSSRHAMSDTNIGCATTRYPEDAQRAKGSRRRGCAHGRQGAPSLPALRIRYAMFVTHIECGHVRLLDGDLTRCRSLTKEKVLNRAIFLETVAGVPGMVLSPPVLHETGIRDQNRAAAFLCAALPFLICRRNSHTISSPGCGHAPTSSLPAHHGPRPRNFLSLSRPPFLAFSLPPSFFSSLLSLSRRLTTTARIPAARITLQPRSCVCALPRSFALHVTRSSNSRSPFPVFDARAVSDSHRLSRADCRGGSTRCLRRQVRHVLCLRYCAVTSTDLPYAAAVSAYAPATRCPVLRYTMAENERMHLLTFVKLRQPVRLSYLSLSLAPLLSLSCLSCALSHSLSLSLALSSLSFSLALSLSLCSLLLSLALSPALSFPLISLAPSLSCSLALSPCSLMLSPPPLPPSLTHSLARSLTLALDLTLSLALPLPPFAFVRSRCCPSFSLSRQTKTQPSISHRSDKSCGRAGVGVPWVCGCVAGHLHERLFLRVS